MKKKHKFHVKDRTGKGEKDHSPFGTSSSKASTSPSSLPHVLKSLALLAALVVPLLAILILDAPGEVLGSYDTHYGWLFGLPLWTIEMILIRKYFAEKYGIVTWFLLFLVMLFIIAVMEFLGIDTSETYY